MKNNYPITGTFIDEITVDIPTSNWDNEDWKKDLDAMQSVGIDTLIFIRGCFKNKCIYPSKHFPTLKEEGEDLLEFFLSECDKRDMKIFIGMFMTNITWNDGDYLTEIKQNEIFTDEVIERYIHHKSFYGWYIPHEVGNDVFNIIPLFNELSKMCKKKTPDKKVLISPFFYANIGPVITPETVLSPEATYKEWIKILKDNNGCIDICSVQDSSCPLALQKEYFIEMKKAMDEYGIEFWSNCELFDGTMRGFYPESFEALRYKIKNVKPYVKKFICFEFSHFLSPNSIFPSARNLFKQYKEYYKDGAKNE